MKKKKLVKRSKKVFTAILAAAVVMTATVPESVAFAAENDVAEVDFQSADEPENSEEVEVKEDTEPEATMQETNDGAEASDVNDSEISIFGDGSNTSPVAEADGDDEAPAFNITVSMVSSLRYGYTSTNQSQIYVSNGTGRIDSNRKCWLEGEDKDSFECYPASSTNSIWYIKPKVGLTAKTYTATLHATYLGEEATKEISLTVLPRTVYVKWGDHEFTYDKKEHVPEVTVNGSDSILTGDTCNLIVKGAQTDAGTYKATVTTDNPCYKISSDGETQTFTINPRPVEFEWDHEDGYVFEYDGQPHTLIATATGVLEGDICNPVYQETTLDTSTPGLTGPKHCTVTITGVDNPNYTTKHGQQLYVSRAFNVVAKKLSKITLNPKKAKQYDGTLTFPTNAAYYDYDSNGVFASEIEGLVGDDQVYVSSIQSKSATLDNKDVGADRALTLNVYLAGKDKYKYDFTDIQVSGTTAFQASGTATVDPKPVNLQWDTDKFRYDGKEHAPVATIKNGVLSGEICNVNSVTISGEGLTEGKAVNAGNYTATATLDNSNYIPQSAGKEFTIEKVDSVTTTVPEAKNLTYSGEAQELVTAGDAKGGKIQYRLGVDGEWSDSVPKAVDAGDYQVFYKVLGDSNHSDTEETKVDVSIAGKAFSVEITANGGVYAGEIKGAEVVGKGDIEGEDPEIILTYSGTANDGTEVNGTEVPTLAGNYKVTATVSDTNYNLAEEGSSAEFVVKRADAGLTVDEVKTKTYGDSAFTLGISSASDGARSYESSDPKIVTVDANGNITIVGVGTATVKVKVAETANYESAEKSTTVKVDPKTVAVIPDNAKKFTGESDPKLTYKVSGLVGKDTLSGITVTRKAGEKVGKYDITASAEKDANPNYSITFEKAVFSIEQGDQSKLNAKSVVKLDLPLLLAKGQGANKSIKLSWLKYKGATGYECYWSYCDGKQNYKKFATVKNGKLVATQKKLKNNRKYKYFVVAYKMVDGRKIYIAKSNVLHVAMKEAAQTNAKAVSVNKTNISLRNGKTFRIKVGVKLESKGKKEVSHAAAFRYYTVNENVATVSSRGVIKASGKGTTYVYVLANNGAYKKIKVTVK